ncbi:response regulator [Jeotgalibaca caeni]|uniref:response regulator n=1 Tax=Jeotgalibaca caeni TaxID=3028623 RepID=UPI00237D8872|nr:response regulator [Jeotgalibaca caeni]MDE1549099.1 response regulator [Jeotgalibaca caeni]
MMYRVLIVDDEPVVREGLAHLINWQALGFEIVGDAENGLDGIEKINQLHPNIVVTDIRMPIMDGIEMIRKIQETNSEMEVLILSGYSDFSYAKEAIHLGVSSYLLKPVDEEELENELKKIASRMDLKREQRKAIALYQDYSVSKKLKEFVLHQQHKEELELLFSFDSYQFIACNFEISPLNRAEVRERVDKIIQKEVFYFNHNSCLYSLLVNRTTREAEKIVLEISETFKGEQVLVLVSKEGNQFLDIQQLYKEIRQLEKKRYLYEELNVLSRSSIEMYIENN